MQSSSRCFAVVVLFLSLISFRAKAEEPGVSSAYLVPICAVAIVAVVTIPLAFAIGEPRVAVFPMAASSLAARRYGSRQNSRIRETAEKIQSIMNELSRHLALLPMANFFEDFAQASTREQTLRVARFFSAGHDFEMKNFEPWRHRYLKLLESLGGYLDVVAFIDTYTELVVLHESIARSLGSEDPYGLKKQGRTAGLYRRVIGFRGRQATRDLRDEPSKL